MLLIHHAPEAEEMNKEQNLVGSFFYGFWSYMYYTLA